MRKISAGRLILAVVSILSFSLVAHAQSRDELLEQIENKRSELKRLQAQFLAPSDEDVSAFAEFLKQPDTGLTRLLPRETYDESQSKPGKLTIRGGGSYFSFTRRTHEYGWGTQIGLEQNQLKTCFAGADYGMIANLGDVPLEDLSLEYPSVKFLASYEPAREESAARSEYQRFGAGLEVDAASYKTHLPAVVNNSYVLRGIHYHDSDVLVALRVVRKDSDGSLIVLWKMLKKYPKPELARAAQVKN